MSWWKASVKGLPTIFRTLILPYRVLRKLVFHQFIQVNDISVNGQASGLRHYARIPKDALIPPILMIQ